MDVLTFLIIYIIGFVCNYYLTRYLFKRFAQSSWTWGRIAETALISLFSWLSVIINIFIGLILFFKSKKDPPKWL